jgi:hypothetical protein
MQENRKNEFYYDPSSGCVAVPEDFGRDKEDMFALLHEMGHMNYKHERFSSLLFPDYRDFLQEIEAWQYAFRCVKMEYKKEMLFFALEFLATWSNVLDELYGEGSFPKPKMLINLIIDRN